MWLVLSSKLRKVTPQDCRLDAHERLHFAHGSFAVSGLVQSSYQCRAMMLNVTVIMPQAIA
jgi:hypothetical protein